MCITLHQLFDVQGVSLTPREKTLTLYSLSKKKTYGEVTIQVQIVGIKVCTYIDYGTCSSINTHGCVLRKPACHAVGILYLQEEKRTNF